MTTKELNNLADKRVCGMFKDEPLPMGLVCITAILSGTNFIGALQTGQVTIIINRPDGLYCCLTNGNLTKLSYASEQI